MSKLTATATIENPPWGLCPECLEQFTFIRPDAQTRPRWRIHVPIDVLDWQRSVLTQIAAQVELRREERPESTH